MTDPTRAAEIVVEQRHVMAAGSAIPVSLMMALPTEIRQEIERHLPMGFARFERDHMQRPTDIARAEEVERLQAVIERDRSTVCQAMNEMEVRFNHYSHLAEFGRGSYSWDDDRYVKEFGDALEHFREGMTPFRKIARDWSDCPTDPEKIKAARTTPSPVTDETALSGEAEHLCDAIDQRRENGGYLPPTIVRASAELRAALASTTQPAAAETVENKAIPYVELIHRMENFKVFKPTIDAVREWARNGVIAENSDVMVDTTDREGR